MRHYVLKLLGLEYKADSIVSRETYEERIVNKNKSRRKKDRLSRKKVYGKADLPNT